MNSELDYAQMLEIPVNTVNVVKKRSIFKRKQEKKEEDLKDLVVDSVNERVGDYVETEDLTDPEPPAKKGVFSALKDKKTAILFAETVAVCLLACTIFLTNVFMPNSAINTFLNYFSAPAEQEVAYYDFELGSVVGSFSGVDVALDDNGVLSFTAQTSVYPVCDGKIASVMQTDDTYTVEIAHTSSFKSVITGVDVVYYEVGDTVASNLPFAFSMGENAVSVAMYDGETLLSCYTLSGAIPVWNN